MTSKAMRPSHFSLVNEVAPETPAHAREHFLSKLSFETDPADLHADAEKGRNDLLIIDVRSAHDYATEHIPAAVSLPHRQIDEETTRPLPRDRTLVTYCWGPGCNGSTKGAAKLAALGFHVKELIGGIEYWKRDGYETDTSRR